MQSTTFGAHFAHLTEAYDEVGRRTWVGADFVCSSLEVSRELFAPESLQARRPKPKQLEVVALLSGLPFEVAFVEPLIAVQREISSVLGDRLHYWVSPENFGVEYCVFKWPADSLAPSALLEIMRTLEAMPHSRYAFSVLGAQINPDGCVVAKGFDHGGGLFRIRGHLKATIPFLPQKQSRWAHVPLGRILEPLGDADFSRLSELARRIASLPLATTEITSAKLVHETRWYMEEKTILAEYQLRQSKAQHR